MVAELASDIKESDINWLDAAVLYYFSFAHVDKRHFLRTWKRMGNGKKNLVKMRLSHRHLNTLRQHWLTFKDFHLL